MYLQFATALQLQLEGGMLEVFTTPKPMQRNMVIKQAIPIDGVKDRANRVPTHQKAWHQHAGLFLYFSSFLSLLRCNTEVNRPSSIFLDVVNLPSSPYT